MVQDPQTLYKLMILYMLSRVNFPLTKAQIGDFILEKGYTNFLTLQQVIAELIDADMYLKDNEIELRNEVSVTADYYKSTTGEYEAHLLAKEKGIPIVDITLSVPIEEAAISICDNWQKRNQEIYKYLIQQLF